MRFLICDVRTMRMAGVLILTTLLSGCAHYVDIDPEPRVGPTQRLPLRIGVYYPSETREYVHILSLLNDDYFYLGPPTVTVFNAFLDNMFEETVEVQQRVPQPSAETDYDAIIEISIERFFYLKPHGRYRPGRCEISYRIIVYEPNAYETNGITLAQYVVHGKASADGTSWALQWTVMSRTTEAAILDGAEKFMQHFRFEPSIRQWLESHGIVVLAIP